MPTPARPTTLIALALVTLLAVGLAASTWHVFDQTWDEPEHLAGGLVLLDRGHYIYDIQHPPLARLALAVGPYLAGARSQGKPPPDGKPEGLAILYGSGHYALYLTLARAGVLPFLALLVVMTYVWGRTVLGRGGALLAALLTATTPVVLGHGALATLDVAAAATCLLALYATLRWLESGRWRDALVLGLTLGLALGTKLSALPFCGVGGLALLLLRLWERRGRADCSEPLPRGTWVGGGVLVTALIALILTLGYGGRFIYLTDGHRFSQPLWFLFGAKGVLHDAAYALFAQFRVPEALQLYLGGIEALVVHNEVGHLSYLLGEARTTGWWYFYLVALVAKTPLPLLVFGLAGLAGLARAAFAERLARLLALPALFVALMAFSSVFSHINIGVRHILVVFPMLAVGAAFAFTRIGGWLAARPGLSGRVLPAVGLALVLGTQLAILVRAWPDNLAYFNVLVRDPESVLVDSDLDWGQDLKRLIARLHELKVGSVALAYSGSADLKREGLPPYVLLKPDEHATGWVAVSALARAEAPEHFDWLADYPRRERVGKTIDLYFIPPDEAQ